MCVCMFAMHGHICERIFFQILHSDTCASKLPPKLGSAEMTSLPVTSQNKNCFGRHSVGPQGHWRCSIVTKLCNRPRGPHRRELRMTGNDVTSGSVTSQSENCSGRHSVGPQGHRSCPIATKPGTSIEGLPTENVQ